MVLNTVRNLNLYQHNRIHTYYTYYTYYLINYDFIVILFLSKSFNRKNEPIVETPQDAIKSFLQCKGTIEALYLGKYILIKNILFLFTTNSYVNTKNNLSIFVFSISFLFLSLSYLICFISLIFQSHLSIV
jgi:hypothetical protein